MLFVAAGVVCYLVWGAYFRVKDEGGAEDKDVVEVVENSVEKPEDNVDDGGEVEVVEKEKVVQYEGGDPNEAAELTGVVTYTGVVGNKLTVRVNIDQYLVEGKCNLVLVQDGAETYGAAADIVASVSTSTCDGFDVPLDTLGTGEYEVVINLVSGSKTGVIRGGARI